MTTFTADVWAPYPIYIVLKKDGEEFLRIPHTQLLQLEQAITEARRQVLYNLSRNYWHEVDPKLAVPTFKEN